MKVIGGLFLTLISAAGKLFFSVAFSVLLFCVSAGFHFLLFSFPVIPSFVLVIFLVG
jgi:hypothetical protein